MSSRAGRSPCVNITHYCHEQPKIACDTFSSKSSSFTRAVLSAPPRTDGPIVRLEVYDIDTFFTWDDDMKIPTNTETIRVLRFHDSSGGTGLYIGEKKRIQPYLHDLIAEGWTVTSPSRYLQLTRNSVWDSCGTCTLPFTAYPDEEFNQFLNNSTTYEQILQDRLYCTVCSKNCIKSGDEVTVVVEARFNRPSNDPQRVDWRGLQCSHHETATSISTWLNVSDAQVAAYNASGEIHTYTATVEFQTASDETLDELNNEQVAFYRDVQYGRRIFSKDLNYGPEWSSRRLEPIQRDNKKCQKCSMTRDEHYDEYESDLEVHHIIPFRSFSDRREANQLDNLITLCIPCHRKHEGDGARSLAGHPLAHI